MVDGVEKTVLKDVVREMRIVRLGQGVDATGWLAQEALDRTFAAAREYAQLLKEHGADSVRFVATSATRDAGNRQVFVDGIREILGIEPEVISGDEELLCPSLVRCALSATVMAIPWCSTWAAVRLSSCSATSRV